MLLRRTALLAVVLSCALAGAMPLCGCAHSVAPSSETSEWDGVSFDTSWFEEGASKYQIESAAQLAGFGQLVDEGHDFSGATVELVCNIDLMGYSWDPIGSGIDGGYKCFRGTFDGRNNSITGLYVISPLANQGFFANVSDGVLKNFFMQGSVKGRESSAGVASMATNESFENIVSDIDVFSTNYFKNVSTGGICGLYFGNSPNNTFYFRDCVNNGSIKSNNWEVGGLIGSAGLTDGTSLLIEGCENRGYVHVDMLSREEDECIGGLVSQLGSFGEYKIINCKNYADVTATDLRTLGGIVGVVRSGDTTIRNCLNAGCIETKTLNNVAVAAGIVGITASPGAVIEGCSNEGELKTYNGKTYDIAMGFS